MKFLVKKIFALSAVLASASPAFALTSSLAPGINVRNEAEGEVPREFLEIKEGILYGWALDVTIADIVEGKYTTLLIPNDVKKIANLAFALNFTLDETKIDTIKFEDGTQIEEIGVGAFKRGHSLKYIKVGESSPGLSGADKLKKIDSEAFANTGLTSITLPNRLESIGSHAFAYTSISSLIIPNSVQEVGPFAFEQCESLTHVDFSNYENIPNWMFKPGQQIFFSVTHTDKGQVIINLNDNTLKEWEDIIRNRLELPEQYYEIQCGKVTGPECFEAEKDKDDESIVKLTKFTPKSGENYSTIQIPEKWRASEADPWMTITKIDNNLFQNCDLNVPVIFPDSITEIGENVFKDAKIKGQLVLPKNISKIGKNAFQNCTNLTGTINIPNTIADDKGIDEWAFSGCTNITGVAFKFEADKSFTMGRNAFENCSKLSCIDITTWPNSGSDVKEFKWDEPTEEEEIKHKWDFAPFRNISKTGCILAQPGGQGINFVADLEKFGDTFLFNEKGEKHAGVDKDLAAEDRYWQRTKPTRTSDNAKWLLGTYWPSQDDLPTTELAPFEDGDFLIKNVSHLLGLVKESETSRHNIEEYDTINIPAGVTDIDSYAFREKFNFKQAVAEIGENSTDPKNWYLNFQNGLINIGDFAFADNSCLAGQLIFPMSLKTIGNSAFSNCSRFRGSLTLPPQIESIGDGAFYGCVGLYAPTLSFPQSLTHVGQNAFFGVNADNLTINKNTKEIADCAFMGLSGLSKIDLTDFDTVPDNTYNWSKLAFYISPAYSETGIVDVKDDLIDGWKSFLANHGLDTTKWEVQ